MEVEQLNEIANDIVVARLEVKHYEDQLEELLGKITEVVKLKEQISTTKKQKEELTLRLMEAMRDSRLKSWKTEEATFSRAVRKSIIFDPAKKKQIEERIKAGEEIEGWILNKTEYMSIRSNK